MSAQANIHNARSGNVSLFLSIFCAPGELPDAVAAVFSDAKDYRTWRATMGEIIISNQRLATHSRLLDMSDNFLFRHVTAI